MQHIDASSRCLDLPSHCLPPSCPLDALADLAGGALIDVALAIPRHALLVGAVRTVEFDEKISLAVRDPSRR
jgi:hypothetical protein